MELGTGIGINGIGSVSKKSPTNARRLVKTGRIAVAGRKKASRTGLIFGAVILLSACADGNSGPKDTDVEKPDNTDDTSTPTVKWTVETIEEANAGAHASMAIRDNGDIGVAYFSVAPYEDGICDEIDAEAPPKRVRFDMRYASKSSGGTWETETVDSPIYPDLEGPAGLSFAFNTNGEPSIAYNGGDVDGRYDYCGASNAVLITKSGGTWTPETASAESNDSTTDLEASQAGFGVGWWPALAYDAAGDPAIIHRDVHFVYLQSDDKRRADAEFAWRQGGSWLHEAVDPGEGAGTANAIIFDTEGRPIVFYAIPIESNIVSRHGVWAARRNSDGTWDKIQLHSGATGYRISAAMDPVHGEPVAAFYSGPDYGIKIRRLVGGEDFTNMDLWTSEIVRDARYDEGQYVSLAFSQEGDMALAYFRCRLYDGTNDACNPNDEAVVFAVNQRGSWKREVVRSGDGMECGMYPTLAISADDTANIAFQCVENSFGEFNFQLLFASKKIGASK